MMGEERREKEKKGEAENRRIRRKEIVRWGICWEATMGCLGLSGWQMVRCKLVDEIGMHKGGFPRVQDLESGRRARALGGYGRVSEMGSEARSGLSA